MSGEPLLADEVLNIDLSKDIPKSTPKKKKKKSKEKPELTVDEFFLPKKEPESPKKESEAPKKEEFEKPKDLSHVVYDPTDNLRGISGWRLRRKLRVMRDRFVLVRITSLNRAIREYYVPANIEGFTYRKGRYIFDDGNKYWNATARMWCYDYQEPINLPISVRDVLPLEVKNVVDQFNEHVLKGQKTEIDIEKVKEIIEGAGIVDVENAVNPKVLETYLKSNFVQSLVEGASIGKFFKISLILLVILLILTVLLLALNGWSSGLFEELSGSIK